MKKQEDILYKIGRKIKISDNPVLSIRKYYGATAKREMAGTIQTIYKTKKNQHGIYAVTVLYQKQVWTFTTVDVTVLVVKTKLPKPELFNPENLQTI